MSCHLKIKFYSFIFEDNPILSLLSDKLCKSTYPFPWKSFCVSKYYHFKYVYNIVWSFYVPALLSLVSLTLLFWAPSTQELSFVIVCHLCACFVLWPPELSSDCMHKPQWDERSILTVDIPLKSMTPPPIAINYQ